MDDPSASTRGFGSEALKIGGKIFAMPVNGSLVLKLSRDRVSALVQLGRGTHFDPGHGRLLKEWVVLCGPEDAWLELAREARAFVAARSRSR
jgi:hypothetical protein